MNIHELERLTALFQAGHLSQAEFEMAKGKILYGAPAPPFAGPVVAPPQSIVVTNNLAAPAQAQAVVVTTVAPYYWTPGRIIVGSGCCMGLMFFMVLACAGAGG